MSCTKHFQRGDTIVEEGKSGNHVYRISDGEVLIVKKNPLRRLIPIARLHAGDIFGEMCLLDDEQTRVASVVAISDVTVEIYDDSEIHEMLSECPILIQEMIDNLQQRLRVMTNEYVSTVYQGRRISFKPS